MKRSARPVKLNPKYFDVDFKSPKLEVSVKSELGIDSIDAMNADTSVAMVTDPPETSSPTAAPGAKADGTSVRPARQIKPNSKYRDGIDGLSGFSTARADTQPDTGESTTNSLNQQVQPTARSVGQSKLKAKNGIKPSSPLAETNVKSESVDASPQAALSTNSGVKSRAKHRPARQARTKVVEAWDLEYTDDEHPKRPCGRSNCPAVAPICFAGISERCTGNKYTSRWNHISAGEHYCNDCFEYLRGRRGFSGDQDRGPKDYETWKAVWSSKAQRAASISGYLVDQVLPFWARCQKCGKWRQLPRTFHVTPEMLGTFTCTVLAMCGKVKQKDKDCDACDTLEDKRVHHVCSSSEFYASRPSPSLRQCVAAQFLTKFYPDGIGLTPTESVQAISKAEKKKLCPFIVPFAKENRPLHALAVTPDMMLEVEIAEFPDMAQDCPYLYLALRNLALALWTLNPKEWVTKEKVESHIICRGLARISCVRVLPQLLTFLTRQGYINQGLLTPPTSEVKSESSQSSVLVVGGGTAGLAAARCLHAHGVKVTVLEAKSCIGGRVSVLDTESEVDTQSGQLVNGCWNNPLAIMAYQTGISLKHQSDNCPLVTTKGQLVPDDLDRRIEFHYNAILDIISDWRRGRGAEADVSLIDKFKEFHEEFIRETQGYFTEAAFSQQEVRRLVNFYLSNLEFACGCSLDRASSLQWDQNEDLPQFGGPHMRVPGGFGSILKHLAQGLDIKFDCQVLEVNYTDQKAVVHSSQGDFTADKVLVTVPLAVLKKGVPKFVPPLPECKVKAIQSLGAGHVEKVTLQFGEDFWSEKINQRSLFGHVPETEDHMGFFNVFYCHHHVDTGSHSVVSHLVGRGLALMAGKSDEEIIQACLQVLQSLFPEREIPQPQASTVTHWTEDSHTGMAYSYIPVGASGQTYDDMAHTVDGRLHFAGEATHRQFPQTATGAYISGMREAWSILDSLSTEEETTA